MDSKLSKTKNFIGEMLIGLVFVFATVGLILSSVDRFVSSKEYKKSTDVRTITARVVDYDIKSSGDEYDDDYKYVTKLSYEVDGKKYTGKRTYYREVSIGDEKEIEVYLTSRGKYKMKGDDDPITIHFGLYRNSSRHFSYIYRSQGSYTNNCRLLQESGG